MKHTSQFFMQIEEKSWKVILSCGKSRSCCLKLTFRKNVKPSESSSMTPMSCSDLQTVRTIKWTNHKIRSSLC